MDGERPDREDRPVTFLAAAGWTILLKILTEIAVTLVDAVHPGAFTDIVTITASRVLAVSVVLFALLRVHAPEASVRRFIGFRTPPVGVLLLAAAAGAALAIPASWISTFLAEHLPKAAEEKSDVLEALLNTDTASRRAILFATLVVVIPASDELFFRGALFTQLRRDRRADVVILATAAYDALLNLMNPRGMLVMVVVLVTLGWLRTISGSVLPALILRVSFFGALLGPGLLNKPDLPTRPAWTLGALGVALVSIVGMWAICRSSEVAAAARDEDEG